MPPGPVGCTDARSTPSSLASLRTGGLASTRIRPAGVVPDGAAPAVSAAAGTLIIGLAIPGDFAGAGAGAAAGAGAGTGGVVGAGPSGASVRRRRRRDPAAAS